jgi:hypothetical protein
MKLTIAPVDNWINAPLNTTGNSPTADLQCLIIQVYPPIEAKEQPNGIKARKKINNLLEKKNAPHYLRVMAISYLLAGNIKLTTAPTCKVSDLITCGHKIAAAIT